MYQFCSTEFFHSSVQFVMGSRHWPGKELSSDEGPSLK